jgi:hypothetical protein
MGGPRKKAMMPVVTNYERTTPTEHPRHGRLIHTMLRANGVGIHLCGGIGAIVEVIFHRGRSEGVPEGAERNGSNVPPTTDHELATQAAARGLSPMPLSSWYVERRRARPGLVLGYGTTRVSEMADAVRRLRALVAAGGVALRT